MGCSRALVAASLLAAMACSSGPRLPTAARGPVVLEVGGEVKGGPFRLGEADLAGLPQRKVRGVGPAGREATWEGVDLRELAERVDLPRGADTLVVRAGDRRAVAVPLSVVAQLGPVLALRADGAALPAPALAWPDVEHFGLRSDPRAARWWVQGVVRLELVSWAEVYGRALRVPEGAPEGALAGARTFGARCIECHGMRGAGGAAASDLARGGDWTQAGRLGARLAGDHPALGAEGGAPAAPLPVPELAAFLWTVAKAGEGEAAAARP